jgi:hypothetical protein
MVNVLHATYLTHSLKEARDGRGMCHVRGRGEVHAGSWWTNLRENDYLEKQDVDGRIILKWIFKLDRKAWTGCPG